MPSRNGWHRPKPKLVNVLQLILETGDLLQGLAWTPLAVIPKGNGDGCGIGLVEALFKVLEVIVDSRVKSAVVFHGCLHGFVQHRGTGMAIVELKLAIELAGLEQVPLFAIFLDLQKAHDTLD